MSTNMADRSGSEPAVQPQNNPLSKKLAKILDTRLDNDKEMLEALKALSTFFTDNNLRTRRNLRSDIERRSLVINEDFVESFQKVNEQLDGIYSDVKAMNDCCLDMTTRLKQAKEQTHDLINQTTQLQTESQVLTMKSQVADAFLSKFQLSPDEINVLRGNRNGSLHKEFFVALERVKRIHNDCKILLRTNHQTAGLEIMESMALHQESSYERLYRWAQNECRALSGDSPDISSLLCQSMEALQDRPVLFRYTLDEFGTARRTAVVRGFIDALTRGGPGGTPRPIELHSHDPLRYTGDILAWLHQAAASEKEHLQTLLRSCTSLATGEMVQDVLGHITEGICRPFKVRVEQVLISESEAVTLYKLTNLLKFYFQTIGQILSSDASLLTTLMEMETLSLKMFFNSLNCHASKLVEKVELPPADLSSPPSLLETLQLLQDVLASHDSSVVPLDARKQDFQQILASLIDPLLQMCSVSASKLNTIDMATYMINCIYSMQTTLALYEYTDQRLEMLQAQVEAHIDTLISEQASFVLNRAGLGQIYNTIQSHQPKHGSLSVKTGMDGISIKSAMNRFDSYLASPDTLVMPQCTLLLSSSIRDKVRRESAELLSSAYGQMHAAITSRDNDYRDAATIVPRTPEQVKSLLS
ncbi:conserved oligomeric Golgi complex subunit 6-like isoform X2 [Tubulanus polymorphus]|uniref:conserved oligomeric Golgi complex subunit 6-like isoform X2 n=1 Tax=Tubulanus polymorphus TaxID=672921 RepID=UPI003DA68904